MKELPIIDLSLPEEEIIPLLHAALKEVGFLYILNHQVPEDLQTQLSEIADRFFHQEESGKMEIAMKHGGSAWRGYFPFEGELTSGIPDLKEGIYFGVEHDALHEGVVKNTPLHGPNQWPTNIAEMRPIVKDYMRCMSELGQKLMKLTALGLGLEQDYFSQRYGDEPTELFRIFNYPFQKEALSYGVHEHTDMGFLTILKQDENGGLEVKPRGADEWVSAPPIPGTFVINIGDMLELWTHGIYQATMHRVKNTSGNDRMSFPFFFDPSWHSQLSPIDKQLLRDEELSTVPPSAARKWDGTDIRALSQDSTYGEFVWNKVRGVFPELDK